MKRRFRKNKKIRVIPGFHLTLGITVTMLSLIVLIPLASVMVYSLKLSPSEFFRTSDQVKCIICIRHQHRMFFLSSMYQCGIWCDISLDADPV